MGVPAVRMDPKKSMRLSSMPPFGFNDRVRRWGVGKRQCVAAGCNHIPFPCADRADSELYFFKTELGYTCALWFIRRSFSAMLKKRPRHGRGRGSLGWVRGLQDVPADDPPCPGCRPKFTSWELFVRRAIVFAFGWAILTSGRATSPSV